MPRNCARIDADIVQKSQCNVPLNKTAKTLPRSPGHRPISNLSILTTMTHQALYLAAVRGKYYSIEG